MKKLFLIAISCLQLALTIEALAAPPLRVLMPMRLADGSVVMPASVNMAPLSLEGCCAAPAMIGEGSYLQHTGSPRILTILAAFQDVGFTVNDPVKAFEQYLNGDKQEDLGNQNQLNMSSVRQYFETSSHQKFSPRFDIVGPLTLPQDMSYYGGKEENGSDDKFSDFCRDAMELAKDQVSDWSIYDNDKDGRIELVCVIFAGYGQNQQGGNNTLWAKASYQNAVPNCSIPIQDIRITLTAQASSSTRCRIVWDCLTSMPPGVRHTSTTKAWKCLASWTMGSITAMVLLLLLLMPGSRK